MCTCLSFSTASLGPTAVSLFDHGFVASGFLIVASWLSLEFKIAFLQTEDAMQHLTCVLIVCVSV